MRIAGVVASYHAGSGWGVVDSSAGTFDFCATCFFSGRPARLPEVGDPVHVWTVRGSRRVASVRLRK